MPGSAAADNDDDGWCTIESDPGIFTSLVETLGVSNVEFTELWSLDDEALLQLVKPLHHLNHLNHHQQLLNLYHV